MVMKYEPSLDGIRALAILLVVAFHAHVPGFSNGRVGVDVFFVLSGYLITNILMGGRDLGAFYTGRLRRLMPALAAMLVVYVVCAPLLFPTDATPVRDALIAGAYLTDVFVPPSVKDRSALIHTWSLALEMQFYLLWPLVLRLPRRWLTPVLVVSWIALTVTRYFILKDAPFGTPWMISPLRASGLILGGLVSLEGHRLKTSPALGVVGLGLILLTSMTATFTPAEIGAALLIISMRADGEWKALWSLRPLPQIGTLSYGLYLWHAPIVGLMKPYGPGPAFVTGLVLGLGLAAISYVFVESPFRRWGRKDRSALTRSGLARPYGENPTTG